MKNIVVFTLVLFLLTACSSKDNDQTNNADTPPEIKDKDSDKGSNKGKTKVDSKTAFDKAVVDKSLADVDILVETETEGFGKTKLVSQVRNKANLDDMQMLSHSEAVGTINNYYFNDGELYANLGGTKIVMPFTEEDDIEVFRMTPDVDPFTISTSFDINQYKVTETNDKYTYTLEINEEMLMFGAIGKGTLTLVIDKDTVSLDIYSVEIEGDGTKTFIESKYNDLKDIDFPDFKEFIKFEG